MPASLLPNSAAAGTPAPLTKQVPLEALRFRAALESNSRTTPGSPRPVRIFARTDQPIEHPFWGRIVHDMTGMIVSKGKIPLDYCHRDEEVLGFADKFEFAGGLTVVGQLIPFCPEDRASEIIFKSDSGVPYEGSIDFAWEDLLVQFVDEGEVAEVNGYQFHGPGVIARQWRLQRVAICPTGADSRSEVQLKASSGTTFSVTCLNSPKDRAMPPVATEETAAVKPAESPATQATSEKTVEKTEAEKAAELAAELAAQSAPEAAAATAETPAPAATAAPAAAATPEALQLKSQGKRYLDAFGEAGAMYFAQGLSFEEAQTKFTAATAEQLRALQADNEKLKGQLTQFRGERPVSFEGDQGTPDPAATKFTAAGASDNLARFASAIKLPGQK